MKQSPVPLQRHRALGLSVWERGGARFYFFSFSLYQARKEKIAAARKQMEAPY